MDTDNAENGLKNEIIEGRNAVIEALRAGRTIDKIYIAAGDTDKTLGHIASKAKALGIVVVDADRRKLDFMSVTKAHQGVVAVCAVREYASVDDILAAAGEKNEAPFVIVCDEVSDPHNMFYISKMDEEHGDYYAVLEALKGKYGGVICPVVAPLSDGTGVIDLVHNCAYKTAGGKTAKADIPAADAGRVEDLRAVLMEAAAGATEELMEKFFDAMDTSPTLSAWMRST